MKEYTPEQRAAEKQSHAHDDPSLYGITIHEVDGDDTTYVDARTFADEGLCVFLVADQAVVIMNVQQARAAAAALNEMAGRVEAASLALTLRRVGGGA